MLTTTLIVVFDFVLLIILLVENMETNNAPLLSLTKHTARALFASEPKSCFFSGTS
jgi:hypothetical protein